MIKIKFKDPDELIRELSNSVGENILSDIAEIADMIASSLDDGAEITVSYLDEVLFVRIYDGERYLFPMPFMLSEESDAALAMKRLAEYARIEMIPLIITDIPREELEFFTELFPHVDAMCYGDDEDSFYIKINNECDLLDSVPSITFDGVTLGEICDGDIDEYARLCSDRELNKYWGYDVYADNPDADKGFYLDTARREFNDGVSVTFAVRSGDRFVGEAVIYGFDFLGSAEIAVRILPEFQHTGMGIRSVKALIEVAGGMGLKTVTADVMNDNRASIKMTEKIMKLEKTDERVTRFTLEL